MNFSKGSAAYKEMEHWQEVLTSPETLATHSLSEIGFVIEHTSHNRSHARFASFNPDKKMLYSNPFASIGQPGVPNDPLDLPSNDWLQNAFSANANPDFWKLHIFIDNVVVKWLKVNGKTEIRTSCDNRPPTCYKWGNDYQGPVNHSAHGGEGHAAGSTPRAGAAKISAGDMSDLAGKIKDGSTFSDPRSTPPAGATPRDGAAAPFLSDPFEVASRNACGTSLP
jgi:hypothetical protein